MDGYIFQLQPNLTVKNSLNGISGSQKLPSTTKGVGGTFLITAFSSESTLGINIIKLIDIELFVYLGR